MAQGDPIPGLGRITLTSTNPNIGSFSLLASNIVTAEDKGSVRVVTAITDHFSRNPKIETLEVSTSFAVLVDSDQVIVLTRAATDNSAAKEFLVSPCQINYISTNGSGSTIAINGAGKFNVEESRDDITAAIEAVVSSSVGGSIVVELTTSQIRTGSSVPIDSGIPLPGEGKAIQITSAARNMVFNSISFGNSLIYLLNTSATAGGGEQVSSGYDVTQDDMGLFAGISGGTNNLIENEGIKIEFDSDSIGVGDGSGKIYIDYIIRTL